MEAARVDTGTVGAPQNRTPVAVAVAIGNFIERFDLAVYGFLAAIAGRQFFPPGTSSFVTRLSSLAVFAVGVVIRPFGGLALGRIDETCGRRTQLAASATAIGTATTLIGALLNHASIVVAAPLLLVVLWRRLWLSAGGDPPSSASWATSSSPSRCCW